MKKFENDFNKWYFNTHCKSNIKYEDLMPHNIKEVFGWFENLPMPFRWGVYVDFFDEKGIILTDGPYGFRLKISRRQETINEKYSISNR